MMKSVTRCKVRHDVKWVKQSEKWRKVRHDVKWAIMKSETCCKVRYDAGSEMMQSEPRWIDRHNVKRDIM